MRRAAASSGPAATRRAILSDLEHQGFDALREVEFEAGEAIDQQTIAGRNLETAAVLFDQLHSLAHVNQMEEMILRAASRRAFAPHFLLADRNEIRLDGPEGMFSRCARKKRSHASSEYASAEDFRR